MGVTARKYFGNNTAKDRGPLPISQWSLKISQAPCQKRILWRLCFHPPAPTVRSERVVRHSGGVQSLLVSIIKYKATETAIPVTRFIASLRSLLKIRYPMITSNSNIATSCPPRDPENIKAAKHKTKEIPAIPFHNLEKLDK